MKHKIGDYIKRVNNECKTPWLIAFWIGETVQIVDFCSCGVGTEPSMYLCKNNHGIYWRLRDNEVAESTVAEFEKKLPQNTAEFVRDNLILCGAIKNNNERPRKFESNLLWSLRKLDTPILPSSFKKIISKLLINISNRVIRLKTCA